MNHRSSMGGNEATITIVLMLLRTIRRHGHRIKSKPVLALAVMIVRSIIEIYISLCLATVSRLVIDEAGPGRCLISGLAILALYFAGRLVARHLPVKRRARKGPGLPGERGPAGERRRREVRQQTEFLSILLLVGAVLDYGFTNFAVRATGPEAEANQLARLLMETSPTALLILKFGVVSFYCGVVERGYKNRLAGMGLWILVAIYAAIMACWGVYFATFLTTIPFEYWYSLF